MVARPLQERTSEPWRHSDKRRIGVDPKSYIVLAVNMSGQASASFAMKEARASDSHRTTSVCNWWTGGSASTFPDRRTRPLARLLKVRDASLDETDQPGGLRESGDQHGKHPNVKKRQDDEPAGSRFTS